MRTLVSVMFLERNAAMAGVSAVRTLETRGVRVMTVRVIAKCEDGSVLEELTDDDFPPPSGMVAGLVVGGLLGGLFRWPTGAGVGAAIGVTAGLLRDWYESESQRDFMAEVGSALNPGQYAVLLDMRQDGGDPLDVEMQQLGGVVSRMTKRTAIRIFRSQWARDRRSEFEVRIAAEAQAIPARIRDLKAKAKASAARLREP